MDLLTPGDLSDMLQVPYKSLEHWRAHGKGPRYARIGKHVRYRRADVEDWLTSAFAER